MLQTLRGRTHEVMTGVVVLDAASERHATETVISRVTMAAYSDAAIDAYVAGGEPLDKAGAYAIQGVGGALVAGLKGSRSNVVGLPLEATVALLRGFGSLSARRRRGLTARGEAAYRSSSGGGTRAVAGSTT